MMEVMEMLAVRDRCQYLLVEDQPLAGRFWAVMEVPIDQPGEMVEGSRSIKLVAASLDVGGKWRWERLTPAASEVFGELLLSCEKGRWYYILEIDHCVVDMADIEDDDEITTG